MDEFDMFSTNTQEVPAPVPENTNIQVDDLFGAGNTDEVVSFERINPMTIDEQEDSSWGLENDSSNVATSQSDILGDDTLDNLTSSAPPPAPETSYDDDIFADQSTRNEFDSFPTSTLPATSDDILYNDTTRQQSEDSSSFGMFSNPITPSDDTKELYSTEIYKTEGLSPLQAFDVRRQKEIAEKDAEEQRKIEELRQQAKQDIERWYHDRQTHMEQKRETIKKDEDILRSKALEKSDKETCDWGKVVRFLEFSQGTQLSKYKRDLNRMKSCMIHAKRDKDGRKSENGV